VFFDTLCKTSIGILTAGGDLFCGDLFENTKAPALNSLMDDATAAAASAAKLKGLPIGTVYPGHGQPFAMDRSDQTHDSPGG
jgi:glyoxylase-like metal-dependent hydrolase (beta-lactamase superfamily II)